MTLRDRFGFPIQRMSMSNFEISDTVVKDIVETTVHLWNKGFQNIKELAQGDGWSTFLKVKDVANFPFE